MDTQRPAQTLATGGPTDAALEELRASVAEHVKQDGSGEWTLILSALDELHALRELTSRALAAQSTHELEATLNELAAVVDSG